jgi:tripartite-type tricarboxylate transporter receptor subunit TctC
VFTAAPDGYTLLFTAQGPLVVNQYLFDKIPYEPEKFTPVSLVMVAYSALLANPKVPAKDLKELIAYAKANPGTLNFGMPNGAPPHMLAEMFKMQTGTDIQVVPYKGASTLITDMIAGRIHGGFETTSVMLAHLHEGNIRGLAVLRSARIAELPDVPTMVESGVTGVEGSSWSGMLAPADTPPAILARLRADIMAALHSPDFVGKLKMMAADVPDMSAAEFGDFIGAEAKRIAAIMKAAGLKAQ